MHKTSLISIFAFVCVAGCGTLSHNKTNEYAPGISFRFLHAPTTCGFIEYDFQKNNILFVYYYNEFTSSSGPSIKTETDFYEPVFMVEKWYWIIDGTMLTTYKGREKRAMEILEKEKTVTMGEFTALKVQRLEFFDFSKKYLNYHEPPKQQLSQKTPAPDAHLWTEPRRP